VTSIRAQDPASAATFSGTGGGLALEIGLGAITIGGRYLEGSLASSAGAERTMIEGDLSLSVAATEWLSLGTGPRARTFVIGENRIRRLQWETRAFVHTPIIRPHVESFAELWAAPWTDINLPGGFSRGLGGSAGLRVMLPRSPVDVRLEYRVDSGLRGVRRETLEQVSLSAGISFGRR
jgi:hypothetical protein